MIVDPAHESHVRAASLDLEKSRPHNYGTGF